jgi:hypothetical protein
MCTPRASQLWMARPPALDGCETVGTSRILSCVCGADVALLVMTSRATAGRMAAMAATWLPAARAAGLSLLVAVASQDGAAALRAAVPDIDAVAPVAVLGQDEFTTHGGFSHVHGALRALAERYPRARWFVKMDGRRRVYVPHQPAVQPGIRGRQRQRSGRLWQHAEPRRPLRFGGRGLRAVGARAGGHAGVKPPRLLWVVAAGRHQRGDRRRCACARWWRPPCRRPRGSCTWRLARRRCTTGTGRPASPSTASGASASSTRHNVPAAVVRVPLRNSATLRSDNATADIYRACPRPHPTPYFVGPALSTC